MTDGEQETDNTDQAPEAPAAARPVEPDRSPPTISAPTISAPAADYSQAGVPSLDFVRDKIEGRYANSLGSTELAQETQEARSAAEQQTKREEAARERLAAIRRSLRGDSPS